ncbi:MAG: hypothetical protein IJK89_07635 [Clostridia bacterium]|nr:hypothetical protein [Clostridia bacterium]
MKKIKVSGSNELHIHNDRFSVYTGGLRLFLFYLACPVSLPDREDVDSEPELVSSTDNIFIWRVKSTVWEQKEYMLYIRDRAFIFTVKVKGKGAPVSVAYYRSRSLYNAAGYTLFNMQEFDHERSRHLMSDEPAVLEPMRAAPPPFLFPFFNDYNETITGLGVVAKRGEHNFDRFELHAPKNGWKENNCWFSLPLQGYTEIDGWWESPAIFGCFGESDMEVLEKYADWQYKHRDFTRRTAQDATPDWWRAPIFCGWGAQCVLSDTKGGDAKDHADQATYEGFSDRLDELGLEPGVIIIDDKWQKEYGALTPDPAKWRSLREFADDQHEKGRKVLLWFKCWDREGLPDDECILADGKPVSADPTNPKYLSRLNGAIHTLLSDDEGCCGCDGFKVDYMDCLPRTAGMQTWQKGVYGVELMKCLFEAIYQFAKDAKPDALINMSALHPYFAGNCDQFRLHDYDAYVRSPLSTMRFRSQMAQAVMPGVIVDADGFRGRTAYETLRILLEQPEIGVPDLYYFPDDFTEEDWTAVRDAWSEN